LINTDRAHPVRFSRGDRIAQLVVQRVDRAAFVVVQNLPDSERGSGGYGSTGGLRMSDDLGLQREGTSVLTIGKGES
jgi:dUTPase